MFRIKYLAILLGIGLIVSCGESAEEHNTPESFNIQIPSPENIREDSVPVKNIILLIGDGTGLSQVSAAFYVQSDIPNYARFKDIGFIRTSSTSRITDSAAGATAFSAGVKSYNGAIGVDENKTSVETIAEIVSKWGWNTGTVATSSITHATPASFFAHNESRGNAEEIALDYFESEIDFFAGGGLKYFKDREDGRNLISEMENKGFTFLDNLDNKSTNSGKIGILAADDAMPMMTEGRGSFLPDATEMAIQNLNESDSGFFLIVEGSQVDWGGHANNNEYLITELLDFDKAIGVALNFAENDGNTLVIVTADHETGGFTLSADDDYDKIKGTFSTGGHSTTLIPIFAYGPGSDLFRGVYENTEVFHKMMASLQTQ